MFFLRSFDCILWRQVSISHLVSQTSRFSILEQGSSNQKMRSHFFYTQPFPRINYKAELLKFYLVLPQVILHGLVKGFFEIRSGALEMGYPQGGLPEVKSLEILLFNFFYFFDRERGVPRQTPFSVKTFDCDFSFTKYCSKIEYKHQNLPNLFFLFHSRHF